MIDPVLIEQHDAVACITLNRPAARNAIDIPLRQSLLAAFDSLGRDNQVRAVVLRGAGKGFCAGADLKRAAANPDQSLRRTARTLTHDFQPLIETITRLDKPVLAAVNGAAVGIGMALVLACDLILMADDARLIPNFTSLGLIPDGGAAWFLSRRIGYGPAFEILAEGRALTAADCHAHGIVNRVVAGDTLQADALSWAGKLAARAPLALTLTKRMTRLAMTASLADTLAMEAELQTFLWQTEDAAESVDAFNTGRPPDYRGR